MPRVLGTTHRGKTEITSEKQMKYLEAHHIDHTHYSKDGKVSRHTWSHPINTPMNKVRGR